jgi:uncharacterized BrkB/YihY/UPF0761 family membrane protein
MRFIGHILNQDAKNALSMVVTIVGVFSIVPLMMVVMLGLIKIVKGEPITALWQDSQPEQCWRLEAMDGVAYKLNACTGELVRVDAKEAALPAVGDAGQMGKNSQGQPH